MTFFSDERPAPEDRLVAAPPGARRDLRARAALPSIRTGLLGTFLLCLLSATAFSLAATTTPSGSHSPASSAAIDDTNPEKSALIQRIHRITPILFVDAIEPALPFWERLGFTHDVEVPHGDRLGFVILTRDGTEVMMQTLASLEDDIPSLAKGSYRSVLYIEVDDLEAAIEAVGDAEIVMPRRTTEYGADEISFREPGGHVVCFAEFASEEG